MSNRKNLYFRLVGLWLTSLFIFQACDSDRQGPIEIIVANDFDSVSLKGSGIESGDIADQFQLFISNKAGELREGQNPVTGTYQNNDALIAFTPTYPLLKGKTYLVRFNNGDTLIQQRFDIPANTLVSGSVVAQVYPSAKVLPLNVLKFYIQFTDSMARGFAYDNLHFVNAAGDTLEEVYLDLEEELWSPDMKRFTLLLDPGRIKRGLQSLQDLGYVFEQQGEYSLVVNKNWHNAHDQPMASDFRQTFITQEFAENHIADFRINIAPKPGTKEALEMLSAEPNDYALLQRVIRVVNDEGQIILGRISLAQEERLWRFVPDQTWSAGNYQIRIQTILEDLAGNNLVNAFDVDNEKSSTVLDAAKYKALNFSIED